MKSRPEPTSSAQVVDLATAARELQADAAQHGGTAARTILREDDLRVVVLALQPGASLAEHHAKDTATVHVLYGQVRMRLPDRVVEIRAGELLPLAAGIEHDLAAIEASAVVLTLARSAS